MVFSFNPQKVINFHNHIKTDPSNRFNSWKHCYSAFSDMEQDVKVLALHLGFYLASWGMYRGSAAIFQKDYTIHIKTVQIIKKYYDLRCEEGNEVINEEQLPHLLKLIDELTYHYASLQYLTGDKLKDRAPTDTLISKIIIGTLGCSPAFDRYYNLGVKEFGFNFYKMKETSYKELFQFVKEYKTGLKQLQLTLFNNEGVYYPILKLVDMYFWHEGYYFESKKKQNQL